jgi:hypothetical protein
MAHFSLFRMWSGQFQEARLQCFSLQPMEFMLVIAGFIAVLRNKVVFVVVLTGVQSAVVFNGSTFSNNSVGDLSQGGVVFVDFQTDISVFNCTFVQNSAYEGGVRCLMILLLRLQLSFVIPFLIATLLF